MRDIDNEQDILDSRDIVSRISDLEGDREALVDEVEQCPMDTDEDVITKEDAQLALKEWDESEDGQMLAKLKAFEDEVSSSEWRHGLILIRESCFVEYCQQLVSDIGDMPKEIPSYIEIDWDKTADNLRADYSSADFDGVTYLYRE